MTRLGPVESTAYAAMHWPWMSRALTRAAADGSTRLETRPFAALRYAK